MYSDGGSVKWLPIHLAEYFVVLKKECVDLKSSKIGD